MNIYFLGMMIALLIYVAIGLAISKKVKNAEDFYVAGRQAPVALIAGSLIASYASTGMFMGDAATCYEGGFAPMMLLSGMQTLGYILGAVFFGRYLRRSRTLTIPEFFGRRFHSDRVRLLATITAMVTMVVYLLSIMQGIGTLMNVVTGVDYNLCIIIAMIAFTMISATSGSRGVLITDSIMAAVFTAALVVGVGYIAGNSGGWFSAIQSLASNGDTSALLSWMGKPEVLSPNYSSGFDSILWGLTFGVSWASVCMVGPWQASRYQMSKSEHVVVKSAYISALGIFLLQFLSGMGAVMVNVVNPDMENSTHVLIWASMHMMPKLLGVVLLTGILAAGISSATTFLSLIGASMANDILPAMKRKRSTGTTESGDRANIQAGRISMVVVAGIVLALAVSNTPAIRIILYFGSSIIAASWMPVGFACILSKRVTKAGAFWGMLTGFVLCFAIKLGTHFAQVNLPSYLDPTILGIVANSVVLFVISRFTRVTEEEKREWEKLLVVPDSERGADDVKKTLAFARWGLLIGPLFAGILLAFWIIPYLMAV